MIRRLKRQWCKMLHSAIYFAGGRTYQCRTCGERFQNPAVLSHRVGVRP
jgi:hypothetical protein